MEIDIGFRYRFLHLQIEISGTSKRASTKMTTNLTQFRVTIPNEDLDLVHAAPNGDVAVFERLVDRHDRKLLRIAEYVTHNREDSQDVVQEGFLKAFQHLSTFR